MYNLQQIYKFNKKIFNNVLNEASGNVADAKDIKRINDIIAKAKGSTEQEEKLATKMANSIKDVDKMSRRFDAAVNILGPNHPVTIIFQDGLNRLSGNSTSAGVTPKNSSTQNTSKVVHDLNEPDAKDTATNTGNDEEITQEEVTAAINKINKESSDEEGIKLDTFDEMLSSAPFELLKKITDGILYFSSKINKTDPVGRMQKILDSFQASSKRYNIESIKCTGFEAGTASMVITATVTYRVQVSGEMRRSNITAKNLRYCLLDNSWITAGVSYNVDTYQPSSYHYGGRSRYSRSSVDPADKMASFISTLNNYIQKAIKLTAPSYIKIANEYQAFAARVFGNKAHTQYDLDINLGDTQKRYYSDVEIIANKLIDKICEKYDVDPEPYEGWPGISITKITPQYIRFQTAIPCNTFRYSQFGVKEDPNSYNTIDKSKFSGMSATEEFNKLAEFIRDVIGIRAYPSKLSQSVEVDPKQLIDALNN